MPAKSAAERKILKALVAPLVERHGGPPAVAEATGADRTTVWRWTQGDIGWDGLRLLASTYREEIVLMFPAHGQPRGKTKEPPPDWARELPYQVAALVRGLSRLDPETEQVVDQAAAELGLHEQPPDEQSLEEAEAPPGTASKVRRRRA